MMSNDEMLPKVKLVQIRGGGGGGGGGRGGDEVYQSINQSTLFKHGKWLSKLVFRHAV